MKKILVSMIVVGIMLCGTITAAEKQTVKKADKAAISAELIAKAKKEGRVDSVGMPDSWANWKDTWEDLKTNFNIEHSDTDMSSAQEIAKFKSEGENSTADIGDVGMAFGPVAVKQGVTQPYKTSNWKEIPEWAKDKDGNWVLGYTGTIAFIVNKKLVKKAPKSWKDIANGTFKISVGDVGSASQANCGVLAAAFALGGDEKNIEPALDMFGKLAKQGRLSLTDASIANLEKGEVEVGILWDFNALNYRDQIGKDQFEVLIPQDGSVISGYATIINKYAKHPEAAKLAREYILSDKGQINLAAGYAKPIRNVKLPDEVKAKMLPNSQYKNVKPIKDFDAWESLTKQLPKLWQEKVMINAK